MARRRRLSQEGRVGPNNTTQQQLPAEASYTNRRKLLRALSMPLGTRPTSAGQSTPEYTAASVLIQAHSPV